MVWKEYPAILPGKIQWNAETSQWEKLNFLLPTTSAKYNFPKTSLSSLFSTNPRRNGN